MNIDNKKKIQINFSSYDIFEKECSKKFQIPLKRKLPVEWTLLNNEGYTHISNVLPIITTVCNNVTATTENDNKSNNQNLTNNEKNNTNTNNNNTNTNNNNNTNMTNQNTNTNNNNNYYDKNEKQAYQELSDIWVNKKNNSNLFIDGTACCGKTTLQSKYQFKTKINEYYNLANYNVDPIKALSYIQLNLKLNQVLQGYVIDRSPISNLAYQLAYVYMQELPSIKNKYTPHCIMDVYCKETGLNYVLEYINAQECNVLLLIDSNVAEVQKRMLTRNTDSDKLKGTCDQYILAQNAAFSYIAMCLNYTIIDINYIRLKYNLTFEKIMNLIEILCNHKFQPMVQKSIMQQDHQLQIMQAPTTLIDCDLKKLLYCKR